MAIDVPGSSHANTQSDRVYTMHWEAQTPEGGTIPFEIRAKWCPPEGIFLEAACDETRENAVLILDLRKLPKELSRHGVTVAASEDAASILRGAQPGGGLMRAKMTQFGLAPNLKQQKR